MKGSKGAAIAAGVVLLAGCHVAAPTGGGGAAGVAERAQAGATRAARLHLLTTPDACPCPIRLRAQGSVDARPVDLVVNNLKVGTARQPTFDILFHPNGVATGTFSYQNVNYENLGPPIAGLPQGSAITGNIGGATTGPFSLFAWPPPSGGGFFSAPGVFTSFPGGAVRVDFGFSNLPTAQTLPTSNDAVLQDIIVRAQPDANVLEIYSTSDFTGSDSFDVFTLEPFCPQ